MNTRKNTRMRFLRSLIMVAVTFTGTATMAQTKANFSGKWQLDLVHSTNLAKDKGKLISISQQPTTIIISASIFTSENTPKLVADTVYLEGGAHPFKRNKVNDFKFPKGNVSDFTRTAIPIWSDGGKSLTINTIYNLMIDGKALTFKSIEKWTLDSTGQKLTINSNTSYADNTETHTDVYTHM